MKEADAVQKKAGFIQRVLTNGGPCNHTADVNRLVSRLRQEKKSKAQMKIVLQDEIRHRKVILKSGRDLRLAGSLAELKKRP